jgi:hypothetical protein
MLGARLIKQLIKNKVRDVLSKYIATEKELEAACEGIATIGLEIIEIIGIKQVLKLLWYAKRVNLLRFKSFGQESKKSDDVTGKS